MNTVNDMRGKSNDELKDMLLELKREQFNLRFQQASGQLENTARRSQVRKEVARINTLLTERKNS